MGMRWQGDDLLLPVRVQPRSSREQVTGWRGEALCVALTAPPVEGAANQALCHFLAKLFGLPRGRVTIEQGESSRDKVVRLSGLDSRRGEAVLAAWPRTPDA